MRQDVGVSLYASRGLYFCLTALYSPSLRRYGTRYETALISRLLWEYDLLLCRRRNSACITRNFGFLSTITGISRVAIHTITVMQIQQRFGTKGADADSKREVGPRSRHCSCEFIPDKQGQHNGHIRRSSPLQQIYPRNSRTPTPMLPSAATL